MTVNALDPVTPIETLPIGAQRPAALLGASNFAAAELPARCRTAPDACTVRNYYITAEEGVWDYAPSEEDRIRGIRLVDSEAARTSTVNGPGRIGHRYRKARYVGYADANYTQPLPVADWQGFLGPTIRAEVGDIVRVWFWNRAHQPYSIHPHGLAYQLDSEGAWYAGSGRGARVAPGERFVYTWEVPARAGPAQRDRGSILWPYHSHVDPVRDIHAGLFGPLIVYRRGLLPGSGPSVGGPPAAVPVQSIRPEFDREYILFLVVINENLSPYLAENIDEFAQHRTNAPTPEQPNPPPEYNLKDPAFMQSNKMHGINGRVFGNLDGLLTRPGERVRWYLASLGGLVDMHTAHFHGATVVEHSTRKDVLGLMPGSVHTVDMVPDMVGPWLFHCHVDDHMMAGMAAFWRVRAAPALAADVEQDDAHAAVSDTSAAVHLACSYMTACITLCVLLLSLL